MAGRAKGEVVRRRVAFLRAVNVGGRNVKMERLRAIFEALPLSAVATFIASGNVLFDSGRSDDELEEAIESTLRRELPFEVVTMLRDVDLLSAIVEESPLPESDGSTLFIGFVKGRARPQAAAAIEALATPDDRLELRGRELYWLRHGSMTDSKITTARLEKALGTSVTMRNVTTLRKIAKMT